MKKWVYFTEHLAECDLNDKLDEYGDNGWELVSLVLYPPRDPADIKRFLAVCKQESVVQ